MKYLLPIILLVGFFQAENSSAQWVLTSGPYEAYARCLVAGKSALFAGTASGVYRSTDNGATWKSVNYYYPARMVHALAAQDSFIFAADTTGRIYRTSDNGTTWQHLNTTHPTMGFAVTDSLLFAFSDDGAIGRSTNHGDSLKRCTVNNLSGYPLFYGVVRFDSALYAGTSNGIFISRNEGKIWSQAPSMDAIATSLVQNSRFMFTGIYEGYTGSLAGVFRSADGAHWDQMNSGLLDTFVDALITTNDSTVFAGTADGIFRSTNNGSSWKKVYAEGSFLAFTASGSNIFAASYEHILRSSDNGNTWKIIDSGMSLTHSSGFARTDKDLYTITDVGIFRYAQNNSWVPFFEKLGLTAFAIHGNQFLVGTSTGDVYYSIDAGKSWVKNNTSVNGNIYSVAIDKNIFFASTDYGELLRSTDYGLTWHIAFRDSTWTSPPLSFALINSTIIAANLFDGVFRSTDNGINWKNIYIDTIFGDTYTISSVDTQFWAGTRNGIFFSTDLGVDWTRMNGFADTGITTLAIDDKNIFAGINGYGIYKNNNGSWIRLNDLIDSNIYNLTLSKSDLFYSSNTGIWRRPLSEIPSGIKNIFSEKEIVLHSNYPNPFSTQTTISFSTNKREFIDAKIFDLLGKECANLYSGELEPGNHTYEWNATNFPPGAYFIVIRSADGSVIQMPIVLQR